jgi:azurin
MLRGTDRIMTTHAGALPRSEAVVRHYVPRSPDVLAYTDIVSPQDEFSIFIEAPLEKGRYPYLCTFPGHWMVMNGEMLVE